MAHSLCILGRQPALGRAELESLYGAEVIVPVGEQAAFVKLSPQDINFRQLGGSIKLAEIVTTFNATHWAELSKQLLNNLRAVIPSTPGKLQLGISVYDIPVSLSELQRFSFTLKKHSRQLGQSIRIVPNQELALSSAQVFHNRLTNDRGCELILYRHGSEVLVARTVAVQDINSYRVRDRDRPKRDSRVGMLPPKLAQIIINLAKPSAHDIVLDPFCGTGVVLQEASLMNFEPYGTDIDTRMVSFADTNLAWLQDKLGIHISWTVSEGDATDYKWQEFDTVASETYLGLAFTESPSSEQLQKTIHTCNLIIEKFLKNIYGQMKAGSRLCIAVPAWKTQSDDQFKHLPVLDQLRSLGYNRVSFVHTLSQDLVYYRPGQIVARELVVLTRN